MVSHEVRTPLNAVAGASALLAGTALDGEQRELVALLEAGTAHVVLIIEDILLHNALASGSFPVKREPLALAGGVLDPAWRMVAMQRAARAKVATLRVARTVDLGVPARVVGDATRLTQVLTNLLGNSVKFTPEGGAIALHVSVVAEAPGAAAAPEMAPTQRWLRFQVRDTGIGLTAGARARAGNIPFRRSWRACAGDIERVFLPFVQAQQTTVRQYGGNGLGLTARGAAAQQPPPACGSDPAAAHARCCRSAGASHAPWAAT
jgi:signal transduction histidine kinase